MTRDDRSGDLWLARLHRPLSIVVSALGSVLLASSVAQAQLMDGGVSALTEVRASNGPLCRYSGGVPGRYPCSSSGTLGNTSWRARGSSFGTFGYRTGFARVQGSAEAIFSGVGSPANGSGSVMLNAIASYSLGLPLVTIPPPGYTGQSLPIIVTGTVSGQSAGNASYRATFTVGPYSWEANSFGMPNQSIIASVLMQADEIYFVSLNASCSAVASALPGAASSSSCQATADPTFEFDQAAWDALLGEDTFPLADYFSIEVSENLVAVPLDVDGAKYINLQRSDDPNAFSVPRLVPGEIITWTYDVANLGENPIPAADLIVTDSDPRLSPTLDPSSDDGDMILSPFEEWEYTASAPALNLSGTYLGVTVVPGCSDGRNTYENTGRVEISGTGIFDEDVSYYCNDQIYPVPVPISSPLGLLVLVLATTASGAALYNRRGQAAA